MYSMEIDLTLCKFSIFKVLLLLTVVKQQNTKVKHSLRKFQNCTFIFQKSKSKISDPRIRPILIRLRLTFS